MYLAKTSDPKGDERKNRLGQVPSTGEGFRMFSLFMIAGIGYLVYMFFKKY